jgi:hypothetical protein
MRQKEYVDNVIRTYRKMQGKSKSLDNLIDEGEHKDQNEEDAQSPKKKKNELQPS